jgi:hypothetical protein
VKRAYRTLRTKAHPDKGGDAAHFTSLTKAYEVLSDPAKVSSVPETATECGMLASEDCKFRGHENKQTIQHTSFASSPSCMSVCPPPPPPQTRTSRVPAMDLPVPWPCNGIFCIAARGTNLQLPGLSTHPSGWTEAWQAPISQTP